MDCERRWPDPKVIRAHSVTLGKVTFMSNISRDDVANLAKLARIDLSEDELSHLSKELSVILDAVARVQEVAAADVPPTSHPLPLKNVFREDEVRPSLTPQDALSGAPAQEEQRFKVPQILGEEQ
jgi:aspartyl-tRNA(Asn)/glutamyl-tRNA(Gln) amidotransferase subunit C